MFDIDTQTWSDGNLPFDNQLVDGHTYRKEYVTGYEMDYIEEVEKQLEHEPDSEQ